MAAERPNLQIELAHHAPGKLQTNAATAGCRCGLAGPVVVVVQTPQVLSDLRPWPCTPSRAAGDASSPLIPGVYISLHSLSISEAGTADDAVTSNR